MPEGDINSLHDEGDEEVIFEDDLEIIDDGEPVHYDSDDDDQEGMDGEGDGEEDGEAESQPPIVPPRDDAAATLKGHTSSVFCVAVSPDSKFAASGGEDDVAIVWRLEDAAQLFRCHGHSDSVILVSFNKTGKLLVTGDMRGLVQVWSMETHSSVWSAEIEELRWGQWHPAIGSALLAGSGDGTVWLWLVPSGECKVLASDSSSESSCGQILSGDLRQCAISGYADGSVRRFDLKSGSCSATLPDAGSPILSLDSTDSGLAACGCESGDVLLLRSDSLAVIGRLALQQCAQLSMAQAAASSASAPSPSSASATAQSMAEPDELANCSWAVEALEFGQRQLLAVGSLSGLLFLLTFTDGALKLRHCAANRDSAGLLAGIVRIHWLPATAAASPTDQQQLLVTADLRGTVRLWNGLSGSCIADFFGHCDPLLDCCLLPDATGVLSAADANDKCVRLFKFA